MANLLIISCLLASSISDQTAFLFYHLPGSEFSVMTLVGHIACQTSIFFNSCISSSIQCITNACCSCAEVPIHQKPAKCDEFKHLLLIFITCLPFPVLHAESLNATTKAGNLGEEHETRMYRWIAMDWKIQKRRCVIDLKHEWAGAN
jgi:hypothetical protein